VGAPSDWLQNNAWPVDGRTFARNCDGFGVRTVTNSFVFNRAEKVDVAMAVVFCDRWEANLCRAQYVWQFTGREATLDFMADFCTFGQPFAFIKEPKLGFALDGVKGFRSARAQWFGQLPKTGHSLPVDDTIRFIGTPLRLTPTNVFPDWAEQARKRPSFGPTDGPGDQIVWDAPPMRQRWEFVRWQTGEGTVLLTAWEGGRGPYDQEPLSRRMVAERHTARVVLQV
jgi:hypothetical protein